MRARFDIHKAWRIPATLTAAGIAGLVISPGLQLYPTGTPERLCVATILAFGVCSAMVGFGFGLWIAIRSRQWPSIVVALFGIASAALWWRIAFLPMFRGPV